MSLRRRLRAWALPALVPVLALVGGCTREIANPFASFQTRCASLPPASYEVVEVPLQYEEVDTVSIAELTTKSGSTLARHRTSGLTTASFGHQTQSELRLVEQRATGRTCATAHVSVQLSMQPVIVYVASEIANDRCRHDVTREHELKHLAVNREVLGDAARRLREDLPAALGTTVLEGASAGAIAQRFEAALRERMAAFMRDQQQRLAERQATIDGPEEYARVANACRTG